MDKKKIIRSLVLLAIGLFLFWLVFRRTDLAKIIEETRKFSFLWIGISVALNVFSQWIRALRWKILFGPSGEDPRTSNLFLATLILGFTNQIIPRGGEVARLGVINRYEKIPIGRLVGITLAERLTDFIILIAIFVLILFWKFDMIKKVLAIPEIQFSIPPVNLLLIISGSLLLLILLVYFLLKKFPVRHKLRKSIQNIRKEISQGFSGILRIQRKPLFFSYSLLIYAIWFLMLYVMFLAYPPTQPLGFGDAAFTFGLATMAFLIPVQAGMGAWHFVVIQCLFLLGIDQETGRAFALVAHASTNLVYIPLGALAFLALYLTNRKYDPGRSWMIRTREKLTGS